MQSIGRARIPSLFLALLLLNASIAVGHVLSFRSDAAGRYSAVYSDTTDLCGFGFGGETSVAVGASTIAINTVESGHVQGCAPTPSAFQPYQLVVPIGPLAPGTYSVAWTVSGDTNGPRAQFIAANLLVAPPALPIPALSHGMIAMMLILMFVSGALAIRTTRRRIAAGEQA